MIRSDHHIDSFINLITLTLIQVLGFMRSCFQDHLEYPHYITK